MKINQFRKLLILVPAIILILAPIAIFAATPAVDSFKPILNPDTGLYEGGHAGGPADTVSTASTCTSDGIGNLLCRAHQILNSVIPVLVALGVVYFVWGVVQFVIAGGEEAKKKGKDHVIYGIIGLAVIVGLWGLVNIVVNTFGLGGVSAPPLASTAGVSPTCDLSGSPKFRDFLCYITRIINDSIIPLFFTSAVVIFVWGVVQYVINSDEEAKKAKGRQFMIWGIIALAVMISVWGLVRIVGTTFGIEYVLPQVKP